MTFKVALYSFFGARGIDTDGASARVFEKIPILITSLKQGFLSDLKTHIGCFPDGERFYNWHMDRLFLSLAVRKKSSSYAYIDVIRVKNENCEFLQNLCADFLVALSVETPWLFTLFPLKQRKFTV